jgi:Major Facilitator Superfamily
MKIQRAVGDISNAFQEKTRKALLWMNLSHEPFVILYALLPFILRKNLNASILQISILSALRPILPVFSFYWSANLKRNRLRSNLIGAWALARLPFLLVPWVNNVWYLIFCCAVYEFFNKSGIPALIEILKINIPKKEREASYTLFFVLSFLESIALGFVIAWVLDWDSSLWSTLFGFSAIIGLTSVFFQLAVPIPLEPSSLLSESLGVQTRSVSQRIIQPWKDIFSLLKAHPDFAHFQYGFMLGGFSLMLVAPSLSIFYVDYLELAFSSVVTGRSILMGAGIVISSWFWKRILIKERVPQLTQWILFGFACYLFFMVCSQAHIGYFYLSFLFYGIAQAGSHLLWNLSGILFSENENSAPFSRLNILMLGLRGAVAPALGGILCNLLGPIPIFITGIALCLLGMGYTSRRSKIGRWAA